MLSGECFVLYVGETNQLVFIVLAAYFVSSFFHNVDSKRCQC